MRCLILAMTAPALLLSTGFADAQRGPKIAGCPQSGPDPAAQAAPRGPGPLRLVRLDCADQLRSPYLATPAAPSPRGEHVFSYDGIDGLRILPAGSSAPSRLVSSRITSAFQPPFVWAHDGRWIWGVRQQVLPAGWSLAPLEPMRFGLDGTAQPLPALTHPAGGLDALHWAGDRGKALAAFGTRGGYYRPKREDKRPTLAFVDARAGRVLQSIAFADLPAPAVKPAFYNAAAGVDRSGRIYALLQFPAGRWLWWRQGDAPRFVPIDGGNPSLLRVDFAIAPDQRSVLVMRGLSATGIICEHNPNCPPPTPVSGTVADLQDLESGRVLWSITGIAMTFSGAETPAISPDGRYALILMPPDRAEEKLALISMADGRILQLLPPGSPGFFPDGSVWISRHNRIAYYRFG